MSSEQNDNGMLRWMAFATVVACAALAFAILPADGVRERESVPAAEEADAGPIVVALKAGRSDAYQVVRVRSSTRPVRDVRPTRAPQSLVAAGPAAVPGARPVVAAVAVAESRATDAAPPVAEAMRQSACPPGADRTRNLSINDGRGVRRIEWADSRCEVEVRIEGEVTFNEDFTGFATISRGGLVRIREQGVGVDRLLEIRPSSGGSLDYAYRLSGNEAAFDAEAQAWLRGFVPELLRTSGLAADQRAAWLLRTQGPDGLFEEIGRLRSDRTQRLYLSAYLSAGPHDGAELSRAVRTAGAELGSDRELGRFLSDLSARDLGIAEVRSAFLEATSTLESDRELGQVLEGLMEGQELSQNEMQLVLEASLGIGSDRELSGVLMRVIEQGPLAEALRDPFMRALETIESDREYSRVATALLQSGV